MKSFFAVFSFFPIFIFGQNILRGKVINSKNKEGIPFVTVGLIKANTGTTASENGYFELTMRKENSNDSLIFSCVGFKTQKHPVSLNDANEIIIELIEQIAILNDVIVTNKKNFSTAIINDFSDCGNNYITTDGYMRQLAQHFELEKENSLLTEIKICRLSSALILPEKTIFRIRIYDMDTLTGMPSRDLCNQVIEVKTKNRNTHVNLEEYKIYIPNKDFFVAIEWLKIPINENKGKRKVNGKEEMVISYRPSIGWSENAKPKTEVWSLDYKNFWHPIYMMNHKNCNISVAATVKYWF